MTDFKITIPGFYRTRDGRKAEVEFISKYDRTFVAIGGIIDTSLGDCWRLNGTSRVSRAVSNSDLIGPWIDEPEPLYEWAFQGIDGFWSGPIIRTEINAEEYRTGFFYKAKRKLRRFPERDCE